MDQSHLLFPHYVVLLQATVMVFILSPAFSSRVMVQIRRLWGNIRPTLFGAGRKSAKYQIIDMSKFK